jgi:hypothetical protein
MYVKRILAQLEVLFASLSDTNLNEVRLSSYRVFATTGSCRFVR